MCNATKILETIGPGVKLELLKSINFTLCFFGDLFFAVVSCCDHLVVNKSYVHYLLTYWLTYLLVFCPGGDSEGETLQKPCAVCAAAALIDGVPNYSANINGHAWYYGNGVQPCLPMVHGLRGAITLVFRIGGWSTYFLSGCVGLPHDCTVVSLWRIHYVWSAPSLISTEYLAPQTPQRRVGKVTTLLHHIGLWKKGDRITTNCNYSQLPKLFDLKHTTFNNYCAELSTLFPRVFNRKTVSTTLFSTVFNDTVLTLPRSETSRTLSFYDGSRSLTISRAITTS